MKYFIGTIIGFTLIMSFSMASNPIPYTLDVQGLLLGEKYTDAQTRAKLGNNPLRMKTSFDGESTNRTYHYGTENKYNEIWFRSMNQDELTGFYLADSTFSIFEGHLKVGYNISRISQLGGGLLEFQETDSLNKKLYYFYPYGVDTETYLEILSDSSGVIECLWMEQPI